jgi:membrane dipeptidase
MIPVIDGHNDFVQRLIEAPAQRGDIWANGLGQGHLDLARMQANGFAGGFFAVWIPSADRGDSAARSALMQAPPYDLPLPDPVGLAEAQAQALAQFGAMLWMERESAGRFRWVRTAVDFRAAMDAGVVAGILHMEGAEAIGEDLDALYVFHAMGMVSLGPVWSRPTVFAHGVPFGFPRSPDTGPGLTDAGKRLVAECNRLRILIDLSHLNEAGFWDVARLSDAPLVATHSNAHALCQSTRNLTDRQLDAIRDSDGMVGVNFGVAFLREDGVRRADCGLDPILRHLDYLIEKLGEGRVGLGSDFDGTLIPEALGGAQGLPALMQALADHGYDRPLIERLAHGNWLAAMARTFGA